MDRMGNDNGLVQRIMGASARTVVLLGPAGAGKTRAVLATHAHFATADGGRCLLLAPNAQSAARLRGKLLAESPSAVVVTPQALTFTALAGRILAAAGDPARMLSAFSRRLLLRRIVDELQAAGKLSSLSGVAETPGLVVALDRAIAELKRAAVEPEALAAAVGAPGNKTADLLEIYKRYQHCLLETGTYDVEGQMWQARDRLAELSGDGQLPALADVDAVAADGFVDFTPTQLEILSLLAGSLRRVVITLPWADDARSRMWHWTSRTLSRIRRAFGEDIEEIIIGGQRQADGTPLRAIWETVFDFDAPRVEAPSGVSVLAAAGIEAEISAVARRVKRLLMNGARPGAIGVLARSMETYREEIERIFAAHDIPISGGGQRLVDVPVIRFVLRAAAVAPEFAFRDVLGVIKSSYFRPQALGPFDETTVAGAEMLIREGNVLCGRSAYAEAAGRLAARLGRDDEDDDDEPIQLGPVPVSPELISAAAEMLDTLFSLLESAGLEPLDLWRIVSGLQLHSATCGGGGDDALVARDLRALAALQQVLGEARHPPPAGRQVREALGAVWCPPARGESLVDVMDVMDARAIRYEHVFLLGLGEGQFPSRFTEGSLIGDADRLAWSEAGLALDRRNDLSAREMLLFYLAVSRAEATLTLSYRESDTSGRAGMPGSFLLSLLEPLGGVAAVNVEKIPPGRFVPPAESIASARDAFNAGIAGLFRADMPDAEGALCWAVSSRRQAVGLAASGLWAEHRRWRSGPCDVFDGQITAPLLLSHLAERYPGKAVFSASQLSTFGRCPWHFFATYILKLAELAEPQRKLEPVRRGIFCHNVLFRLMTLLRDRCGGPVVLADMDEEELLIALDAAVAAEGEIVESRQPPHPMLWKVQREGLRQKLRVYLLSQQARGDLGAESTHFELGFGMDSADGLAADVALHPGPISLATDAGEIRLRGKIDRVDRVRFEDMRGLLVIDYKTGRLPKSEDILAGRDLQAPLYSAAVERILNERCLGSVFHGIGAGDATREMYFAALKYSRGRYAAVNDYDDKLAVAIATVGRFVSAMRSGRFDVLPIDCPSYCPYKRICRQNKARAELKTVVAEEDLPGAAP